MNIDRICNQIAKQLNIDQSLVHDIVFYEFLYTKQVMQDPTETRDILFNKLFKFKLKRRYKENKNKEYGIQ